MFDIKPIQNKYSKYAHSLDKIFKNHSLEAFQHSLKNPKSFKTKEFLAETTRNKNMEKMDN